MTTITCINCQKTVAAKPANKGLMVAMMAFTLIALLVLNFRT